MSCSPRRPTCGSAAGSSSWRNRTSTPPSTGWWRPGRTSVVAVPLVLLGAGHMKNDGPAALARARRRHPGVDFAYARDLGIHPAPLDVATERIDRYCPGLARRGDRGRRRQPRIDRPRRQRRPLQGGPTALGRRARRVGRARIRLPGPAHGARRPGALPPARSHPDRARPLFPVHRRAGRPHRRARPGRGPRTIPRSRCAPDAELGADRRLARLVLERYREALEGDVRMNCDCCAYRVALPGYEDRLGTPLVIHTHTHDH